LDTFTRKVYVKGINPPVFDSPDYPRGALGNAVAERFNKSIKELFKNERQKNFSNIA